MRILLENRQNFFEWDNEWDSGLQQELSSLGIDGTRVISYNYFI